MTDRGRAQRRVSADGAPAEWEESVLEMESGGVSALRRAFVVGVLGDSGSGKSTLATALAEILGRTHVAELWLDDYYRFTRRERAERGVTALNPEVHDLALLRDHLDGLRAGRNVRVRSYQHEDGAFGPPRIVEARDYVIARGLLGFPSPDAAGIYDFSVFLNPEPDLLFRWKTRRDVLFRGYEHAQVLRNIADHLLDAKQYVGPQAALADMVVDFALPEPDAPDSEVIPTVRLRGPAAMVVTKEGFLDGVPATLHREAEGVTIVIPPNLSTGAVTAWAARRFEPGAALDLVGIHHDESGAIHRSEPLAFVHLLAARLTRLLAMATG